MAVTASLSSLIVARDWASAYQRIRDAPHEVKQQSGTDLNGTALEGAIRYGAPEELTMIIYRTYPKAAKVQGKFSGHFPLFEAAKVGASEEVFEALLLAYPDALAKERRFRYKTGTPYQWAKWNKWQYYKEDKIEVMEMLHKSPQYWKARKARATQHLRASLSGPTPLGQDRGFSDALGPVPDNMDGSARSELEEPEESEQEAEVVPTVMEVLETLNLPQLEAKFKEQDIESYDDLKDLSLEDMKEMGLTIGARNRLKKWIAQANAAQEAGEDPEIEATKHYASLFEKIGDNGDGKIDLAEFSGALKALGKYRNDYHTRAIFELADTSGDGFIDLDEFIALMKFAKEKEGEQAAMLKSLANNSDDATYIGKLANSCRKHSILMQHVFETAETEDSWASAQEALKEAQASGAASTNMEADCQRTFDFLILDSMFSLKAAETTCNLHLTHKINVFNERAKSLKEKGTKLNQADVDRNELVDVALNLFRETCSAYCRRPENRHPEDRNFNQLEQTDLHEFRLCAMQLACAAAVDNHAEVKKEAQRLLMGEGTKYANMAVQYGPMIYNVATQALAAV